jgi:hypothetical protein
MGGRDGMRGKGERKKEGGNKNKEGEVEMSP